MKCIICGKESVDCLHDPDEVITDLAKMVAALTSRVAELEGAKAATFTPSPLHESLGLAAEKINTDLEEAVKNLGTTSARVLPIPTAKPDPAAKSVRDFRTDPRVGDRWMCGGYPREILAVANTGYAVVQINGGACVNERVPIPNEYHSCIPAPDTPPCPECEKLRAQIGVLEAHANEAVGELAAMRKRLTDTASMLHEISRDQI